MQIMRTGQSEIRTAGRAEELLTSGRADGVFDGRRLRMPEVAAGGRRLSPGGMPKITKKKIVTSLVFRFREPRIEIKSKFTDLIL